MVLGAIDIAVELNPDGGDVRRGKVAEERGNSGCARGGESCVLAAPEAAAVLGPAVGGSVGGDVRGWDTSAVDEDSCDDGADAMAGKGSIGGGRAESGPNTVALGGTTDLPSKNMWLGREP